MPPTDPALLTTLVQGGSFAVLVALLVYAARVLAPAVIAEMKEQRQQFLTALDRQADRHERWEATQTQAMSAIAAELRGLAEKTAEHSALLDECPYRQPAPTHQPPM